MSKEKEKDNEQQLFETVKLNSEILAVMLSEYEPYVPEKHEEEDLELLTSEDLVRRIRPTLDLVTAGDVSRNLYKMGCKLEYVADAWYWKLVRRE